MNDYIPMEVYSLTLTHTIVDKHGYPHDLEEPLILETCVPRFERFSTPLIVSEMADKMKYALLERIKQRSMPTDWSRRGDDDV